MNKATNIVAQHPRASMGFGTQLSGSEYGCLLEEYPTMSQLVYLPTNPDKGNYIYHRSLGTLPTMEARRLPE